MNTPIHPHIQRTLAAIVVTDAVGFSKRMSRDEDKALSMINRDLQLISELCEFFDGKILKTVGDGVLMYFVSAVQAAACAVEIQKTFSGFTLSGKTEEHFTHRVGVHLGDIFFNQTDMMGTGVNIAARLESEAHPGSICMSQVVYDVVKSRLELDASYIGELDLKNIEEAVAAYHVWPAGLRPLQTEGGESTEAVAPLTITPLSAALRKLSEHPNSRRIKKLLYGTHQSIWENDISVLQRVPLRMLIESLTDRNATFGECRSSLYKIVGTLNRQEEYTQVANIILEQLKPFYTHSATAGSIAGVATGALKNPSIADSVKGIGQATEDAVTEDAITGESQTEGALTGESQAEGSLMLENPLAVLYADIADHLDCSPDQMRMKKMLYCLCYDRWENDGAQLSSVTTKSLVTELYRQISTLQGLQNRLRTILMRLNRKSKYAPIANLIFDECQILYPEGNSQISRPGLVEIDDSSGENTQINVMAKKSQPWMGDRTKTTQQTTQPTTRQTTQQTRPAIPAAQHPIPAAPAAQPTLRIQPAV